MSRLVYTYYEIGRVIVEDEQGGYGDKTLAELSSRLTDRFGKGWSMANLKLMRQFFLVYSNSLNTVYPIGELGVVPKPEAKIVHL
ncbi:MAG: hypothetical protein II943_01360 [Victivallales bacterium]|nr:hypothetical protein [Victivallales bacterium]